MIRQARTIAFVATLIGVMLVTSPAFAKKTDWSAVANGSSAAVAAKRHVTTSEPKTVKVKAGLRTITASYYESEANPNSGLMCIPESNTEVLLVGCRAPLPVTTADPVVPQAPLVVTVEDVSRVLVAGSGAMRQPPGEQALLSKPLIAYTDPSPRTLTTTVAGTPVELHLTPVSYTWNWGDGTTTTTADPGATYPNHSVTHYYSATATNVVVTLTTAWDARFRPTGTTTWQPVTGQVTTTDHTTPFDIVRRITVLTDTAEELQGH